MIGTGTWYSFICMSTKKSGVGLSSIRDPNGLQSSQEVLMAHFWKHEPPSPLGTNLFKKSHSHHWCIIWICLVPPVWVCPCLSYLFEDLSHSFGLPGDEFLRSFWPGPFGQLCCGGPEGLKPTSQATAKICRCVWWVWFAGRWVESLKFKHLVICGHFWNYGYLDCQQKVQMIFAFRHLKSLYAYPQIYTKWQHNAIITVTVHNITASRAVGHVSQEA